MFHFYSTNLCISMSKCVSHAFSLALFLMFSVCCLFVCLFVCPILTCLVLFYIFFYYYLEVCLFCKETQKGCGFGCGTLRVE